MMRPHGDGPMRLLVVGGSQGARILGRLVPEAVAQLPADMRSRVKVDAAVPQRGPVRCFGAYSAAGVEADCQTYMADLPQRLAAAIW
jgi:UDP-N-acetylglucosamine--N-acetylmuramyl-(pentapeptide) pyrophosphoryl-undecaprenol N-acetylglucosamine transferase